MSAAGSLRALVAAAALAVAVLALAACRGAGSETSEAPSGGGRAALEALAEGLVGTFTNGAQAAAAPDEHASERLVVVRVWPRRGDGPWLLVERAPLLSLDRPTRVEVWRLASVQDGLWRIDPFGLPGTPSDHAGAFARPALVASLSPAELVERPGCRILLSRSTEGAFHGATLGSGCDRDANGLYTTLQLGVLGERVTLWERQHDAGGRVVAGHPREAALFDRRSRHAPTEASR